MRNTSLRPQVSGLGGFGILRALARLGFGLVAAASLSTCGPGHGTDCIKSTGTIITQKREVAPGLVTVTDVLAVLRDVIPIEAAHVMGPDSGEEPGIFADFRRMLPETPLQRLGRYQFYDMARSPDLALAISTGEQRIYANLLLTIGVVMPE